MTRAQSDADALCRVLCATAPADQHPRELMLFGQFIGSWRADWTWTTDEGAPRQLDGEVHFGWILAGRAIQDTWIVPVRDEWAHGDPPRGFYGTTIRFYDPSLNGWRSTWIDPPSGLVRRFIGRSVDGQIVLVSDEQYPAHRWRFSDITDDSFIWQAELKRSSEAAWERNDHALLRRQSINHQEHR